MTLQLLKSSNLDNWYVIKDHLPCIEGDADEWRQIAEAIGERRDCYFKRCAVQFHKLLGVMRLYSPRNACENKDFLEVNINLAEEFSEHIRKVLAAYEGMP